MEDTNPEADKQLLNTDTANLPAGSAAEVQPYGDNAGKPSDKEHHALHHLKSALHLHTVLTNDRPRNIALYEAMKQRVTKGCSVLDIGSGSGVLAILAAKLGAGRVVAVESSKACIPIIRRHAQENGVADMIEIVEGNSRKVSLNDKFDCIISETIGNWAIDEGLPAIMADAVERFLKPGGAIIPQKVSLSAAPARFKTFARDLPAGLPIKFSHINRIRSQFPIPHSAKKDFEMLANPETLFEVDLRDTNNKDFKIDDIFTFERDTKGPAQANCVALWANAQLTDRIAMSVLDSVHWSVIALMFEPFTSVEGRFSATLKFASAEHEMVQFWKVSLETGGRTETRVNGPFMTKLLLKEDECTQPRST